MSPLYQGSGVRALGSEVKARDGLQTRRASPWMNWQAFLCVEAHRVEGPTVPCALPLVCRLHLPIQINPCALPTEKARHKEPVEGAGG